MSLKCTLIGHSIGGAIASLYAKQYPHNVDAIIFIKSASKRIPDKDLEKHYLKLIKKIVRKIT